MKLALFDLDGTLLPGDSDHAFGEFMVSLGLADGTEHRRRNDEYYTAYLNGTLDIHDYVRFCTSPWRGLDSAELARLQRRFTDEIVEPMIRPAAIALVERHRAAGDLMAIVTATNDFVTRPIADRLGVAALIATELERDGNGRVTGGIRGVPAFREGKIERVTRWLADQGLALGAFESSTFYSDSTNDLPLLQIVSHPVATNPGPGLRQLAGERGWPVIDLFH